MEDLMRVKRLVAYCTKKCGTSDPFEIADQLGILYQIGNCEHEGCYMFLKNHRYIFLSNRLDRTELNLVMAHELGHALLDRKANCYFILMICYKIIPDTLRTNSASVQDIQKNLLN